MKKFIIGIAGAKNSGKDTVASMINYIFAVGVTRASYAEYLIKRTSIDNTYKDRIVHFADGLKDILSNLYNIPRDIFDERIYKDNMYYNLRSGKFIPDYTIENQPNTEIITIDRLKSFSLNNILNLTKDKSVYIKLRTLMQYFGTNICREQLADDIWIRQTMNKAINIAESRRLCLIPDVRFANEASAIECNNDSLYGGVIMIKRDSHDNTKHSSEIMNFTANYEIDNNSTLIILFYKVLEICQKLI